MFEDLNLLCCPLKLYLQIHESINKSKFVVSSSLQGLTDYKTERPYEMIMATKHTLMAEISLLYVNDN